MERPNERDPGRGLSRRSFLGAAGAAVVGSSLARAAAHVPSASAATSDDYVAPALEFGDAGLQAALGAPYGAALENLIDINTVHADPAVYDSSGLISYPPGTFAEA